MGVPRSFLFFKLFLPKGEFELLRNHFFKAFQPAHQLIHLFVEEIYFGVEIIEPLLQLVLQGIDFSFPPTNFFMQGFISNLVNQNLIVSDILFFVVEVKVFVEQISHYFVYLEGDRFFFLVKQVAEQLGVGLFLEPFGDLRVLLGG